VPFQTVPFSGKEVFSEHTSANSSGRSGEFVTAAEIAQHLDGRKSGEGWVARCPARDDTTASLSLRDADGKVLAHSQRSGSRIRFDPQEHPGLVRCGDVHQDERSQDCCQGEVMQRCHQQDLSGHLLEQGGWEHLRLPAEYEEPNLSTSIGWSDPGDSWASCCGPSNSDPRKSRS
jgi:hypothetical protein